MSHVCGCVSVRVLRSEELWVRGERRSLLEARLFPVLHPRRGAVGLEGGVAWLLGGGGCLGGWREAWRLSLKEVLLLTHQETELQRREELLFLVGRRRVADALRGRSDVCLLPCFRAAVLGGQQGALLEALDSSECPLLYDGPIETASFGSSFCVSNKFSDWPVSGNLLRFLW